MIQLLEGFLVGVQERDWPVWPRKVVVVWTRARPITQNRTERLTIQQLPGIRVLASRSVPLPFRHPFEHPLADVLRIRRDPNDHSFWSHWRWNTDGKGVPDATRALAGDRTLLTGRPSVNATVFPVI
jgi:hypothetical protein